MGRGTVAEISLGTIRDNVKAIRNALPASVRLMAVVKANGYGHGAAESARMAEDGGAERLAVAYLEEALDLRAAGVKLPILILTPIHPADVHQALRHGFMVTVAEAEWFYAMRKELNGKLPGKLQVHIKADTGLGRLGLRSLEEWEALVPWLEADDIEVDGFYTHFATAGKEDTSFLERQYTRFQEMLGWCLASGIQPRHCHCAGSAAALRFPGLSMDMVRIGAAMYGFSPGKPGLDVALKPALALKSSLIAVRKLGAGESLGYDNSYTASGEEWIGTVPIGYADGWHQGLRHAEVLVEGLRAPIVGKICMDQLMVKLPWACPAGTPVVLIGNQGGNSIAAAELAKHLSSVPQEVSSSLSVRVERIYIS